jgi:hypothetical protein
MTDDEQDNAPQQADTDQTEAHSFRGGAPAEKPVEEIRAHGPVEEPETEAHRFPIAGSETDRSEGDVGCRR